MSLIAISKYSWDGSGSVMQSLPLPTTVAT